MIKYFLFLFCIFYVNSFEIFKENDVQEGQKVVCYFGSWAVYRNGNGKIEIPDIDPNLCTHVIYAFVGINEDASVRIIDAYADLPDNYGKDGYGKIVQLKERNPNLKVILAIGGWNEGSIKFSKILKNADNRAKFVDNVIQFVRKYKFDGFDFDWEYPNQRGGSKEDIETFVETLKELHFHFHNYGLLLSAAVGSAKKSASLSYNIAEVSKNLDMINLMAYDFHGGWDNYVGINAPLYSRKDESDYQKENLNVDSSLKYWLDNGADPKKIVMGIPLYGRSFRLHNANNFSLGAQADGKGIAGQYSGEEGSVNYNEICEKLQTETGWKKYYDNEGIGNYIVKDDDWIGYDDPKTVYIKTKYAMERQLGGVMVWSVEGDDFHGVCGEKYPLLNAIQAAYNNQPEPTNPSTKPTSATDTTTTSKPTKSPEEICASGNGFARDPDDCSVYYVCQNVNGKIIATKMHCPANLVFNIDTSACDYTENVMC